MPVYVDRSKRSSRNGVAIHVRSGWFVGAECLSTTVPTRSAVYDINQMQVGKEHESMELQK